MTTLHAASKNLVETIKELRNRNIELRFLNLAEIEAALELDRPPLELPPLKLITTKLERIKP